MFRDDFGDTTFPETGFLDVRIRNCEHHGNNVLDDDRDRDGDQLDAD